MLTHDRPITRAWVLHPDLKSDHNRRAAEPALEEGIALAAALPDLEVIGGDVVRLPRIHPGKLFGKGKIAELKNVFHDAEIELVLIDGPVTPVQQRNLDKEWGVKLRTPQSFAQAIGKGCEDTGVAACITRQSTIPDCRSGWIHQRR